LRLFFSLLVCLDLPDPSTSRPAIEQNFIKIVTITAASVHLKNNGKLNSHTEQCVMIFFIILKQINLVSEFPTIH
jgi:hypothetical protein